MRKTCMFLLGSLVLLFSLGIIGAGYARWSDAVQVKMDAATGNMAAGIRCVDVGEKGQDQCCVDGQCKDQKSAVSCTVGPKICEIGEMPYYDYLDLDVRQGCTRYEPHCTLEIGNGGTVPAKIKNIYLEESVGDWSGFRWMVCTPDGRQLSGTGLKSLQNAVSNKIFLDPQQKMNITLKFCGNECDSEASCRIKIDGTQWNV